MNLKIRFPPNNQKNWATFIISILSFIICMATGGNQKDTSAYMTGNVSTDYWIILLLLLSIANLVFLLFGESIIDKSWEGWKGWEDWDQLYFWASIVIIVFIILRVLFRKDKNPRTFEQSENYKTL
jgi:hypothetical protein